jgi:hypothetical protein
MNTLFLIPLNRGNEQVKKYTRKYGRTKTRRWENTFFFNRDKLSKSRTVNIFIIVF